MINCGEVPTQRELLRTEKKIQWTLDINSTPKAGLISVLWRGITNFSEVIGVLCTTTLLYRVTWLLLVFYHQVVKAIFLPVGCM